MVLYSLRSRAGREEGAGVLGRNREFEVAMPVGADSVSAVVMCCKRPENGDRSEEPRSCQRSGATPTVFVE